MLRTYSVRLVALTLAVPIKWVDNLLSHHELPGVSRSRQGIERRITDEGLLAIETTRLLTSELGVPIGIAAAIARTAVESRAAVTGPVPRMHYVTASGLAVDFPLAALERRLRERIIEAVESVPRIPRGRPRAGSSAAK